ncbi:prolyl oligopeptidase family serine peptidase [Eudoraea chungangensis]|uniref:prolyl oligopeptidase family serine peptidase n=1 Tax=Eudoraea chungangensis TaxID=1481905 RepID=UPI0023EBBB53|nr:prolyl oligopeptidase family serine peptidase [Eudoraea chungangensis]
MKKYVVLFAAAVGVTFGSQAQEDDYLWLEEVDSPKALEFVESQSENTLETLKKEKEYSSIYDKSLEIYNSSERIAYPSIKGDYVYNFWKDKDHVRGIWRRCSIESYNSGDPDWETLLDVDELSEKDNIKWVFKKSTGLYPEYNRFLLELSKGGGDAVVTREFDANKKQFVEDGFFLEESKGFRTYLDENTLIVSTDFGEGTMTNSGYPIQVKLWQRGTQLKDAQTIFEGETTDAFTTYGYVFRDGDIEYTFLSRTLTTFTSQNFVWIDNKAVKIDVPEDATVHDILNNEFVIELKSDWVVNSKTYKLGSLLSLNFTELIKGNKEIKVILEPSSLSSISEVFVTKNKLLVNLLTDVTSELFIYSFENNEWSNIKVTAPDFGTISVVTVSDLSDIYYFNFQNFIIPSTLYSADAGTNTFNAYKSLPAFFDASNYEINQFKAKSKDGTMVPYFMISSKTIKKDGANPALVFAYGGFEVSYQPFYLSSFGTSWLAKGGVFVLANIRGGGEYGPKWHQEGMKEKRQNVFDDLYAVSEDLIAKNISSPEHLGVMGGSNGGLLVGVAFTQRPELYNAVVCLVPLLDMQRYNKLLAGASWMGEYGNPDIPEEWAYIKKYSPYHNLKEGMNYPEVYFYTSTKDDRVHPAHARKMVAKMNGMGYKTYYYENTEGGHAGSSTNEQRATSSALMFSYLWKKLR